MMDDKTQQLDMASIAALSALLQGSYITGLTLKNNNTSIHLQRQLKAPIGEHMSAPSASPEIDSVAKSEANTAAWQQSIVSTVVGRLLLLQGATSFPKSVETDDLVAVVQIGLLQLPIRAPKSGNLALADVEHGQVVSFGTELFKYNSDIEA